MSVILYNSIEKNIIEFMKSIFKRSDVITYIHIDSETVRDTTNKLIKNMNDHIKNEVKSEMEEYDAKHIEEIKNEKNEQKRLEIIANVSERKMVCFKDKTNVLYDLKFNKIMKYTNVTLKQPLKNIKDVDTSEFIKYGKWDNHWNQYMQQIVIDPNSLNEELHPFVFISYNEINSILDDVNINVENFLKNLLLANKYGLIKEYLDSDIKKMLLTLNTKYVIKSRKRKRTSSFNHGSKKNKISL